MHIRLLLLGLFAWSGLSAQDASNAELLFHWYDQEIPGSNVYDNAYNECWGMVEGGREYAVIGTTLGTHIFDVTEPETAYEAAFVEGAVTGGIIIHRDFHDYNGYLYAVADEGFSSLQIIDITGLPDAVEVVYDSSEHFQRSHNIFIDGDVLYVCGGNTTLDLYSLEDPENPTLIIDCDQDVPGWNQIGYLHDIYVKDGIAYCNNGSQLYIVDFTDTSNPVVLGDISEYPEPGYNHSGWLHPDGNLYAMADETHGSDIKLIDVSDPSDLSVITTFQSNVAENSIVHNLIWNGDFLHVSHYYDGYYVWDCSDPENPVLAAYYDTCTIPHQFSYEGAWGVYPLLPSGNVIVSDMQEGLFLIRPELSTGMEEQSTTAGAAFPNPAQAGTALTLPGAEGTNVAITDGTGRLLTHCNADRQGRVTLPASLETGWYVLRTQNTASSLTYRVFCQR